MGSRCAPAVSIGGDRLFSRCLWGCCARFVRIYTLLTKEELAFRERERVIRPHPAPNEGEVMGQKEGPLMKSTCCSFTEPEVQILAPSEQLTTAWLTPPTVVLSHCVIPAVLELSVLLPGRSACGSVALQGNPVTLPRNTGQNFRVAARPPNLPSNWGRFSRASERRAQERVALL